MFFITAVLWCSRSHIYGVSEGQWRLLPGTARRLCRQVNCRNLLELYSEDPLRAALPAAGCYLSRKVLDSSATISGWGNFKWAVFHRSQCCWIEDLLLLVKSFISSLHSSSFILTSAQSPVEFGNWALVLNSSLFRRPTFKSTQFFSNLFSIIFACRFK